MSHETPAPDTSPLQRALAYVAVSLVVLSLAAFAAILTGTATGAAAGDGFNQGFWPVVFWFPLVALPLGFILILILLFVSMGRRARHNRGTAR